MVILKFYCFIYLLIIHSRKEFNKQEVKVDQCLFDWLCSPIKWKSEDVKFYFNSWIHYLNQKQPNRIKPFLINFQFIEIHWTANTCTIKPCYNDPFDNFAILLILKVFKVPISLFYVFLYKSPNLIDKLLYSAKI